MSPVVIAPNRMRMFIPGVATVSPSIEEMVQRIRS